MLSNLGKIRNKGVEIGLHSVNIESKDFRWTSDFAFSLNRNKVVTIYGEDNDGDGKEDDLISSGYFIGKTLGTIYNYKVNGMWQQKDVDNGTIMEGMRPGDYKLEDVDGDGKISSDKDRQFLGTSKENFRRETKQQICRVGEIGIYSTGKPVLQQREIYSRIKSGCFFPS